MKLTDTSFLLFTGMPEEIEAVCLASLEAGVDIVAPGCVVAPDTSTENMRALTTTTRKFRR